MPSGQQQPQQTPQLAKPAQLLREILDLLQDFNNMTLHFIAQVKELEEKFEQAEQDHGFDEDWEEGVQCYLDRLRNYFDCYDEKCSAFWKREGGFVSNKNVELLLKKAGNDSVCENFGQGITKFVNMIAKKEDEEGKLRKRLLWEWPRERGREIARRLEKRLRHDEQLEELIHRQRVRDDQRSWEQEKRRRREQEERRGRERRRR